MAMGAIALGTVLCSTRAKAEACDGCAARTTPPEATSEPRGNSRTRAWPDEEPAPPEAEPTPRARPRKWYGWQTLAVDSVVLGAAAATNTERSNGALGVIIPAYALGVPIVHALHGRWDATGASVAMRVLVPLAFVVATFNGDGSGTSDARSVLVGVGVALPVIVDAAFLAWGNPKAKRAPPAAFDVAGHVTRDAASVSVSGAF